MLGQPRLRADVEADRDRGAGGTMVIDVGTGVAIGILMDTFLVRTLLVPSAVVLLGRWNWWPSRLSKPVRLTGIPEKTAGRAGPRG